MKNAWIFAAVIASLFASPFDIQAEEVSSETLAGEEIRILELIPHLLNPLAVDPAIPKDYVAMAPDGELDPSNWIYWGPKEALEVYFKDQKKLSQPIFRVTLNSNTLQKSLDTKKDFEKAVDKIKHKGAKVQSKFLGHWGNYPVGAFQGELKKKKLFIGWVGLNAEKGWTLLFEMLVPENKNRPNTDDIKLWKTFLEETKQLPEPQFFKAHGQDLQPGFTIVTVDGSKLRVTAEERKSDNKLKITVLPLNDDVEFQFKEAGVGLMAANWKKGEPLAKVWGTVIKTDGNCQIIDDLTVSILLKLVDEFTITPEEQNPNTKALVFQE